MAARALYQLDFYLRQVNAPFTVKDIYRGAYQRKQGAAYCDGWLDRLEEDPDVKASLQEPFTTHSIAKTLLRTGHEPLLRQLVARIRAERIGYMQAYIVGAEKER